MLNQVTLVGRLVKKPEVVESENKTKRSIKNVNGEYETDFIDCILWQNNALNTAEYCNKGDIIGIRGRIQTSVYEKEGTKIYKKEIIAEKVTFLSGNKKEKAE